VKQYENLTYCHSVNVAMLSLLLGRQVGLDEQTLGVLVEAALLHDVGKTRVPLEVLKKPAALDKRERRLMEAHTTYGAEILVEISGLMPLTPTVALEHHRTVRGRGYPDLGDGEIPHFMSQIVSVADIYEAITGARSYQDPALPEQACLILARLAGEKLNTALVKMFVNAITFFPLGSVVRTDQGQVGVVVRTTPGDPLHPVIAPLEGRRPRLDEEIDTSRPDDSTRHGARPGRARAVGDRRLRLIATCRINQVRGVEGGAEGHSTPLAQARRMPPAAVSASARRRGRAASP
jgi:putative nucleotidyltransferase with HDIG domain